MASIRIEFYVRDQVGSPLTRSPNGLDAFDRLTDRQLTELKDVLATAANDWIEFYGLDRHEGIAARCYG